MAFGSEIPGDTSSWTQKPPKPTVEPPEPPAQPDPPPATPDPGAAGPETIDDDYVVRAARASLPGDDDFRQFVEWRSSFLPDFVRTVQAGLGDQGDFIDRIKSWITSIRNSEKDLNTKQPPAGPTPTPRPQMPGTGVDELCASDFDTKDLALKGRKSVLVKEFFTPLIFPEFQLGANQRWAFGQRLDYRQEWRHDGFTLGELISSLSLLPNEELTIEVSSWQRTKSEVEQITDRQERERLERELSRTDEESATNQAAASNSWTVAASGGYSLGPVSASVSASASGNTEQRSQQAERHVTEATTKATNEVSLKRALKMTQTAEAGSEQRTARRIRNPNACHTVTFNFFQIVKLFDVQFLLTNDAVTVMLPGLFPPFYTKEGAPDPTRPVKIPYWTIEAFSSPAVFLTQFFDVDRDLSQDLNGWALRVRTDPGAAPDDVIVQLIEALAVAVKFLLRLEPNSHRAEITAFVTDYVANALALRERGADSYGKEKGRTEQMTTPGIYVDSLLGRCTACEDYVEASRFFDVLRQREEAIALERQNELAATERDRRKKLLEANTLDPFGGPPADEA
jgi:hypothetical protein